MNDYPCPFCDGGVIRDRWRATGSSGPLAASYIVGSCDRCNGGSISEERPAPRPAPRRPAAPVVWHGGYHDLRAIPSAHYVALLTNREVVGRYVCCPFHADGRPSLHVRADDGGWFCHACGIGGGVFEFYAALQGRSVPTVPREFARLAGEITDALRRAA